MEGNRNSNTEQEKWESKNKKGETKHKQQNQKSLYQLALHQAAM